MLDEAVIAKNEAAAAEFTKKKEELEAIEFQIEDETKDLEVLHKLIDESDARYKEQREKEQEYNEQFAKNYSAAERKHEARMEQLEKEFFSYQETIHAAMEEEQSKLDAIKATHKSAFEAMLEEQKIQDEKAFYTIAPLSEKEKEDISFLKSIESKIKNPRAIRKLIWEEYYRDRVKALTLKQGAEKTTGIYQLLDTETGLSYVGKGTDIGDRWSDHCKKALGMEVPGKEQLYEVMTAKGIEAFAFRVLEKCDKASLNEKEKKHIDIHQAYDYGLNKTRGNNTK